jgi:hypothetical protein
LSGSRQLDGCTDSDAGSVPDDASWLLGNPRALLSSATLKGII